MNNGSNLQCSFVSPNKYPMSAEKPIIMTYSTRLQLSNYIIITPKKRSKTKSRSRNFTAAEIMRDPASIKGRLLPYLEVHLSLQIPTHG